MLVECSSTGLIDRGFGRAYTAFYLGESQFSSWQAGAKSPVIKLARVMKARKEMTPELTAWIKANTDNRFCHMAI